MGFGPGFCVGPGFRVGPTLSFGPEFVFGRKLNIQAPWTSPLRSNTHGCSKCRKVLDQGHWSKVQLKNHRQFQRDLVCADCCRNGFSAGRYEGYECQQCKHTFGSLKFQTKMLENFKCRHGSLICKDWNG